MKSAKDWRGGVERASERDEERERERERERGGGGREGGRKVIRASYFQTRSNQINNTISLINTIK